MNETATFEVGNLLSPLSASGVERRLQAIPGVLSVSVNPVPASATVSFDPAKVSSERIRSEIEDCGHHCAGELRPRHVCDAEPEASGHGAHATHTSHIAHAAQPQRTAPATAERKTSEAEAGHHDMMHDMGHAPGQSMDDMVRDMRNRFFVALFFSVPVFVYSPMGAMLGDFAVPFGMDRKLFLFIVASAAILYPGWPFYIAAWRALHQLVRNPFHWEKTPHGLTTQEAVLAVGGSAEHTALASTP